jgi:hypothetical protein
MPARIAGVKDELFRPPFVSARGNLQGEGGNLCETYGTLCGAF